jgi:hypothetical protein
MARKNTFFLHCRDTAYLRHKATVVQVEHNGKKKTLFSSIVETQPAFAAGQR